MHCNACNKEVLDANFYSLTASIENAQFKFNHLLIHQKEKRLAGFYWEILKSTV